MSRNIIRDGHTRSGYLEADDGRYESMRFRFRPMLPEQVETVEAYVAANSQKDPVKTAHCVAGNVCKQLAEWSEVEPDGKPSVIHFENVRKLPFPVLNRMYRIIALLQASDKDPEGTPEEAKDYVEALIEETTGIRPMAKDADAVKNSERG